MDKLVEWTNKYAQLHPSDGERGLCERQGRILGVKYIRFRSAEKTSIGYLILSYSTPRNKLYRLFYIIFSGYHQAHIPEHGNLILLILLAKYLSITDGVTRRVK